MVLKFLGLILLLFIGVLVIFGAAAVVFISFLLWDEKSRAEEREENEINSIDNNSSE